MPQGALCPHCGQPVMAFGRFFREAEPSKTSRCSHCNVELKRHKTVWLLLGIGAVVLASIVGVGIPFTFERWGAAAAAVFVTVFTAVAIIGLKVCGWLFVGWDPAGPRDSNPVL